MAIEVGARLAHYDVTALIGEGGMGRVYQATDTKLNRQVALKILPEAFASDPDRLARFQREAQVLASLNHPNIGQIHGIEEADGTQALVLELIDGPTLADRIAQGPIPVDEALPIAKQIAEALEAAHEAGVIHRDLKPANIKIREDGTVKVLDFGLAKAIAAAPEGDPNQSPTLTAAATQMGVIMGTAAYMSPEQAHGKPVDKRSDVWAFGAVLFEMVTGQHAFAGDTISETLANVLKAEPDWSTLPADIPTPLRRLLRRCLVKDRKRRLRDTGSALLDLDDASQPGLDETSGGERAVDPASRMASTWRRVVPWASATFVAGAALSVLLVGRPTPQTSPEIVRLDIIPDAPLALGPPDTLLAVSPDGTSVAFIVRDEDGSALGTQLVVRALDTGETTLIPRTEGARQPFFSPDGASVGFFGSNSLQVVDLSTQQVRTVTSIDGFLCGASWRPDGTIVYGQTTPAGLYAVSGSGGGSEPARRGGH